jgi:hypothetical protein
VAVWEVATVSVIGEIRTSLVQTSAALDDDEVVAMLDLLPGRFVRRTSRPVPYAASPERFVGIDCALALPSRTVRAVGTVGHRTIVTGGHIIQGSAYAEVRHGPDGRRLPWSHYLASPGRLETIGKGEPDDAAQAFLDYAARETPNLLDLGSVADQSIDTAQYDVADLDRRPPMRVARGRLRWSVVTGGHHPSVRLRLDEGAIRAVSMVLPEGTDIAGARGFCEDLALHDWLLTTVDEVVRRSGIGRRPSEVIVERLRPAIDHLLHLWSPGARRSRPADDLWSAVEDATGLDQQWQILIRRIRDQLALAAPKN